MDLALVSCRTLPEPDPDAAPLAAALAAEGLEAPVVAWDDPDFDWTRPPFAVFRSCWNYPQHYDAFMQWLARTAPHTPLFNHPAVVRWNAHKRYLLALADKGLPVTPTLVAQRGQTVDLQGLMRDREWPEVVVKPAISGGSWRTERVGRETIDHGQRHLDALLAERDALVQPFLPAVQGYGERAVVVIDGEVTHAVRKSPRFSADDESVEGVAVSPEERTLAERTVSAVGGRLLYARVDMTPGPDGDPILMELELIEPSLFFDHGPRALSRFIDGIQARRHATF